MASAQSPLNRVLSSLLRSSAQTYLRIKRPTLIAVAGSVGKTSTKLMLAHVLSSHRRVAYMDDSYNNGLGLYLSVFEQKVPTSLRSPISWMIIAFRIAVKFVSRRPDYMILEYGIDHPGDMDELVQFATPDIALLSAVTPEHMEYLKTIETVASEETKILKAATHFAVVNANDVDASYLSSITTPLLTYGDSKKNDAHYAIKEWTKQGAIITLTINNTALTNIHVGFVSEALIRQLVGAALVAHKIGISLDSLKEVLESAQPAASRMRLFEGITETTIIDDTTNFSPSAGIEALKALKRLPAQHHLAILGNMHELGEYAEQGFADVAKEFQGLSYLIFVGEIAKEKFIPYAKDHGFVPDKTLFYCDDAIDAGVLAKSLLSKDDVILVKGPFGGFYLEEVVKLLLKNPVDSEYLTRQSAFWQKKKRAHFGKKFDQSTQI